MKTRKRRMLTALFVLAGIIWIPEVPGKVTTADSGTERKTHVPANATHCDPSLPISIELTLLDQPSVRQPVRFQARVHSRLDPDLIRRSWVEWDVPTRVQRLGGTGKQMDILSRTGRGKASIDVVIPDEARYAIRARLVVELIDGQRIAQTSVQWVDLGEEDAPEGMVGRLSNPDGTGIRVYRGATVRK